MRRLGLNAVLWLLVPSAPLWADAVISVDPPAPVVAPGQTFSLAVDVAGVSDLYGYQFDLYFNPAILSALSVSEGPFLSSGGSTFFLPGTIDNTGGTITDNGDILETAISGVSGSGTLLNFSFQALSVGDSSVQIENLTALNSFGEGLVFDQADSVVTVAGAAAPEPAMGLLFAAGFVAMAIAFCLRRLPLSIAG
jgi:general secretion pathway protein D